MSNLTIRGPIGSQETGLNWKAVSVQLSELGLFKLFPTGGMTVGTIQVGTNTGTGIWSAGRITPIVSNDSDQCEWSVHPSATELSPGSPISLGLPLDYAFFGFYVNTAEAGVVKDVMVTMKPQPASLTASVVSNTASGSSGDVQFSNGSGDFSSSSNLNWSGSNLVVGGGGQFEALVGGGIKFWNNAGNRPGTLTAQTITSGRTWTMPDSDGEVSMTSTTGGDGALQYYTSGTGTNSSNELIWDNTNLLILGGITATTDIEVTDPAFGFIIQSPDTTRWRISVSDLGILSASTV